MFHEIGFVFVSPRDPNSVFCRCPANPSLRVFHDRLNVMAGIWLRKCGNLYYVLQGSHSVVLSIGEEALISGGTHRIFMRASTKPTLYCRDSISWS